MGANLLFYVAAVATFELVGRFLYQFNHRGTVVLFVCQRRVDYGCRGSLTHRVVGMIEIASCKNQPLERFVVPYGVQCMNGSLNSLFLG